MSTIPFATALEQLIAALRATDGVTVMTAEIGAPCTEPDIQRAQEALGHPLSDAFLAYYRSANGAQLAWESPAGSGGFTLVPLPNLLTDSPGYMFGIDFVEPGESSIPLLGGTDEHGLRQRLAVIDAYAKDGNEYPTVALVKDDSADPLVIFPNDACAALCDFHPMLATSYFEMLLATAGHRDAIYDFAQRGYAADHEAITWGTDEWRSLGAPGHYVQWLQQRGDVLQGYAPAMSELAQALRSGTSPADLDPKRWIEMRYGHAYPG